MAKSGSQMISNLFGGATGSQPAGKDEKIWRVTEVLSMARSQLEGRFASVAILGEISQFKAWRSGHWYFSLKDAKSSLNAVMFRGANQKVPFDVQDGIEVVAYGRLTLHPERSQVQIMVDRLEPLGAGALALAFEQLKKKLTQEGLFKPEHKKPIPDFPQRIGIVTSPQGAALRDLLRVLQERWPGLHILLSPTRVQGKGAAQEIARALNTCDAHGQCDLIIVTRGGGSLEDLWAFNEEPVARAVFGASTPVVSAVGHATDTTIIDFVSDLSVATPTHAASLVPEKKAWAEKLQSLQETARETLLRRVQVERQNLLLLTKSLPHPEQLLRHKQQILDDAERTVRDHAERLLRLARDNSNRLEARLKSTHPLLILNQHRLALTQLKERMERVHPKTQLEKLRFQLSDRRARCDKSIEDRLHRAQRNFATHAASLEMLSPLSVLSRGYALAQKDKALVTSSSQLRQGDSLTVQFSDGLVATTVEKITPNKE